MLTTPRSNRLHIGFFGKRNAGKSSIVNSLTNQHISLVSDTPGTTTDPVIKSMELLPIGPIAVIDTAGLDDEGSLGKLRIKKSIEIMDRTDLAVLVFNAELLKNNENFDFEKKWFNELSRKNTPMVAVLNKIDTIKDNTKLLDKLCTDIKNEFHIPVVKMSAMNKLDICSLKDALIKASPSDFEKDALVGDIIKKKDLVLLVAPQDIQAPKGRLILPEAQTIRDLLDNNAMVLSVTISELEDALACLKDKPALVITDSQVFKTVNSIVPKDVPLTSFSILMARYKGDLKTLVDGAKALDTLEDGDKVLIAEACTHHPLKGDIAREKIPRWIREKYKKDIEFTNITGVDFPGNLSEYKVIIQCGSCMFTRKQLMSRIIKAEANTVPITNFGVAIAHLNGILPRVIEMFPKLND
ncbi:MAG: [FeFe] hydrogenase H-cluster maturation GTPase HydF [Inconstantimicrobium porci]|uniref:[FeFe] hydrogenase H-cluster maturation GTPase HydF n=1 Tax=Inconstantimicrobium porci TaxID=2652291 RepID=UPI002409E561|nr:[FeFe] hydrogenase H-cluster maturation GTPase HydF [Inconstantimicrobium porci]MDD6770390.1 [FeFe] hydrogenase H-cluster maturation GTPase HydF [Inconstantimicrobium porci]MDY5913596.1 [FeFe] hydrogenase H-cluster maturation GTPase HydF [Inconstantimicrobium porci]